MLALPTASGLARAIACPASTVLLHGPDRGSVDAARGTALHAHAERVAKGMDPEASAALVPAEWRETAQALDVAAVLVELGHDPFGETIVAAEESFAWNPATDTARSLGHGLGRDYSGALPGEAVGTADLVIVRPEGLVLADWKFGHGEQPRARSHAQLRSLALYAARHYGRDGVTVAVLRGWDGGAAYIDRATLGPDDLAETADELRALSGRIAAHRASPETAPTIPGPHCRYCPAAAHCPMGPLALLAAEGRGIAALGATPEGRARLLGLVTLAKRLPELLDLELRDAIERGDVALPDGQRLAIEPSGSERLADADLAFATLAKIDPDVADRLVPLRRKATLGGIDKGARDLVPGAKAPEAKARVRALLVEAGAVKTSESDAVVAVPA